MDSSKEVLSLRILAARFISNDELEGLAELDRIAADLYRLVYWQYLRLYVAFTATLFASVMILIPGIGLAIFGVRGSDILLSIGLVSVFLLAGVLRRWRFLQYGGMTAQKPQTAIYAAPNDPAARNLECLFTALQLETAPRAFFLSAKGIRWNLSERYFFGTLRAALISRERPLRDLFLAPASFWFRREIFIEVEAEALIAQAKAKPKRAGAKKTYDYTDAVMSLIEHPTIRAIDPRKHGSKTKIIGLLRDWYVGKRQSPPSDGQLGEYASMIQDAIEKNRSADS